jgi:hypothetical protein
VPTNGALGGGALRKYPLLLACGIATALVPAAHAQSLCDDLLVAIDEAGNAFAGFRGVSSPMLDPADDITAFKSTYTIGGSASCGVADFKRSGVVVSTSFTCTGVAADTDDDLQKTLAQFEDCMDVRMWRDDRQPNGPVTLTSSYGQFILSLSRFDDLGLVLGIEVFRDERGDVKGSPVRGDAVGADGKQRCTPKSRAEIVDFLAMYGEREGATRFENDKFVGYTNQVSGPLVAFMTKPNHPAHPAIIVRKVWEEGGSVMVSAGGDFAGDCVAFHALLEETRQMNSALARQ